MADRQREILAGVLQFLAHLRELPCDRIRHITLLFVLAEESLTTRKAGGLSIAALAHRASVPLEAARHGVRILRMERLVSRVNRTARTEFFALSQPAKDTLLASLAAFEKVTGPHNDTAGSER